MSADTDGRLTDRELVKEITTIVSYLSSQLSRLDFVLQDRAARLAEETPRLQLVTDCDVTDCDDV
jgi:hypothetical protein